MQLMDFGAIMNSAQAGMPDYAADQARKELMGLQRQQLAMQVQKAQQQLAKEKSFQTDLEQVLINPTDDALARLIMKHPDFAQEIKSAHGVLDESRRRDDLRQMGEIYSAAKNGRYDLAATSLERRIEADRAVDGTADPVDEAMLAALKSGDPVQQKAAMGQIGIMLSAITGPEKFGSTLGTLNEVDQTKDYTLSPGQQRRDGLSNEIIASAPFAPRPITVGEGDTVVEYQPGGGDPASTLSGGAPMPGIITGYGGGTFNLDGSVATPASDREPYRPRGIRNNNPGNLKDGPFAKAQPGYKGTDSGGFAIFESADAGMAAQTKLLANRYLSKGIDTPDAIVERYAPPSENSPESRANYKAHIARGLGIGVNDKISPDQAGRLAQLMAAFENGISGVGGGNGGPGARVIAQGAPKPKKPVTPSETRVVNGQVFVKINGQWYRKK